MFTSATQFPAGRLRYDAQYGADGAAVSHQKTSGPRDPRAGPDGPPPPQSLAGRLDQCPGEPGGVDSARSAPDEDSRKRDDRAIERTVQAIAGGDDGASKGRAGASTLGEGETDDVSVVVGGAGSHDHSASSGLAIARHERADAA